jgi:hypothetical protein
VELYFFSVVVRYYKELKKQAGGGAADVNMQGEGGVADFTKA